MPCSEPPTSSTRFTPFAREKAISRSGARTRDRRFTRNAQRTRRALFRHPVGTFHGRAIQNLDYSSPYQAYAAAQGQLAYYRALDEAGEIRLILSGKELDEHIEAWQQWEINPSFSQPALDS